MESMDLADLGFNLVAQWEPELLIEGGIILVAVGRKTPSETLGSQSIVVDDLELWVLRLPWHIFRGYGGVQAHGRGLDLSLALWVLVGL